MNTEHNEFLKILQKEWRPTWSEKIKSLFRPAYRSIKYPKIKKLIDQHIRLDSLGCNKVFMDEGHYDIESRMRHLQKNYSASGKKILVAGCGYGQHLYVIAKALKPEIMICIDPFPHALWDVVKKYIEEKLGTKIIFLEGTLESLENQIQKNSIDVFISDAVLEHVQDMDSFLNAAHSFLKTNGVFYSAFGPLWYSPSGDHKNWGENKEYFHLMTSKEQYEQSWEDYINSASQALYPTESYFLYKNKLFSYLKPKDYVTCFKKYFLIDELWAGISPMAINKMVGQHGDFITLSQQIDKTALAVKSLFVYMRKVEMS